MQFIPEDNLPSCVDGPFPMHASVTKSSFRNHALTIFGVHVFLCRVVNVSVCVVYTGMTVN